MSMISNQYSDPISFVIEFALNHGCELFTINNAKDQLKKLKENESQSIASDSIDQLLSFCETALNTGKWQLTPSLVYNAKNDLIQLRKSKADLAQEAYKANTNAAEETNLYLETAKKLEDLQTSLDKPVAWAQINNRGDLYDLRLQNNPYNDQSKVIPLYRAK